jgi:hypothetical protein
MCPSPFANSEVEIWYPFLPGRVPSELECAGIRIFGLPLDGFTVRKGACSQGRLDRSPPRYGLDCTVIQDKDKDYQNSESRDDVARWYFEPLIRISWSIRLYHHLAILMQPDPPHEHQMYKKSQRFDCASMKSKRLYGHCRETVSSAIQHQIFEF